MKQDAVSLPLRFVKSEFVREYGMVFVLLLLCLFLSVRTVEEQHPTGAGAGRQVARRVLSAASESPNVLIVAGTTDDDSAFTQAAAETVAAGGGNVLAIVNGTPRDVVIAIRKVFADGNTIDAVAVTDVASKWGVFENKFPEITEDRYVTPKPYYWPTFLKLSNLTGVADQTTVIAIIAIGMTMVIITKGIDLSVGSLVALSSITMAVFVRDYGGGKEAALAMLIAASAIGIGFCACSGLFVGLMVTACRIPPFIVTLAMLLIARGLAMRWNEGESVNVLPQSFNWLGGGDTLGIPNAVLLMLLLYVIAHVVMANTAFGRHLYAIGGNEEAATLSGIRVNRMLLMVYTLCGALAGLGGIVLTSRLGAGDPKLGVMLELDVIAAVVVGGTSILGGRGRMFGTLIGAFIIAVIRNGMNLTGVAPFDQSIVLGAVLLGAVLLDTLKRRLIK